jgi:hypothetical protein
MCHSSAGTAMQMPNPATRDAHDTEEVLIHSRLTGLGASHARTLGMVRSTEQWRTGGLW